MQNIQQMLIFEVDKLWVLLKLNSSIVWIRDILSNDENATGYTLVYFFQELKNDKKNFFWRQIVKNIRK